MTTATTAAVTVEAAIRNRPVQNSKTKLELVVVVETQTVVEQDSDQHHAVAKLPPTAAGTPLCGACHLHLAVDIQGNQG